MNKYAKWNSNTVCQRDNGLTSGAGTLSIVGITLGDRWDQCLCRLFEQTQSFIMFLDFKGLKKKDSLQQHLTTTFQ